MHRLPECFDALSGFGILSHTDLYLADALNRRMAGAAADAASLLACGLVSRRVTGGHVCLFRQDVTPDFLLSLAPGEGPGAENLSEEVQALCREISAETDEGLIRRSQGLIGVAASKAPVVIADGRLYLRRYWQYEARVASRLLEMAACSGSGAPAAAEIERLCDGTGLEGTQRHAVLSALTRRLTVITGGPGTGKTFVAGRIISLLRECHAEQAHPLRIRLAAPTGKAAQRLAEGFRDAMPAGQAPGKQPGGFDPEACTLDRLLGYVPDSHYFRHNRENPLPADVVLIDEASMIDLPKMAKLLDALAPDCRLVLLGDMHQLASVEPGSVLGDICSSKGLAGAVVELTESRRFPADSPVAQLSAAINSTTDSANNAAWPLLSTLNDASFGERRIRQLDMPRSLVDREGRPDAGISEAVIRGFGNFLAASTPEEAFRAIEGFRVLCALRRGPCGVRFINRLVESILSGRFDADGLTAGARLELNGEFYDHRVIMVTRNDYGMSLFNGDIGIVLSGGAQPGIPSVWFPEPGGGFRAVPCRLLPEHETAFAMTVHKSQGSEFERTLVLLPAEDSPVLTRELVYTAITRTRTGLDLWCSREAFLRGISRSVQRSTGLLPQLDACIGRGN